MKIIEDLVQRSPEWHAARKAVITGSRLEKIVGTPYMRKKTFYDVVAERVSTLDYDPETALQHGISCEDEARTEYEKESGYTVKTAGFTFREDNRFMGESPDGLIDVDGKYRGALEIKCLSSGNHVKAKLDNKIPDEYIPQVCQKFIVNDDLEWVDFVMYDPRIPAFPYLKFRLTRKDLAETIESYRKQEETFLKEVNDTVKILLGL